MFRYILSALLLTLSAAGCINSAEPPDPGIEEPITPSTDCFVNVDSLTATGDLTNSTEYHYSQRGRLLSVTNGNITWSMTYPADQADESDQRFETISTSSEEDSSTVWHYWWEDEPDDARPIRIETWTADSKEERLEQVFTYDYGPEMVTVEMDAGKQVGWTREFTLTEDGQIGYGEQVEGGNDPTPHIQYNWTGDRLDQVQFLRSLNEEQGTMNATALLYDDEGNLTSTEYHQLSTDGSVDDVLVHRKEFEYICPNTFRFPYFQYIFYPGLPAP